MLSGLIMFEGNIATGFGCSRLSVLGLHRACVMYTVLSSLAACGRLGVAAAAAGVFVCHA